MNSPPKNNINYLKSHFDNAKVKYAYTLMIVDDSDIELQIHAACLSDLCYIVKHYSAAEALADIASGTLPDLILLDANMPSKNGYQMCDELKKHSITADIMIVIFTSNTDIEYKLRGFQSGCSDYLSKPMNNDELYHRVDIYLQHIQKRRELEMLSFIDPVTGVANRRTYEFMLQKEWNRCIRYSSCVSLLVIDINHFQKINDIYGNHFGDECIRRVATILAKFGLRSNDLFARFGGQEFVLMLPGCNMQGGTQIASNMINMVKRLNMDDMVGDIHNFTGLTISIGIAMDYPQANKHPAQLFERADDAKFLAKQLGVNRFITNESPVEIDENTHCEVPPHAFSGSRARGQFQKRVGDR